MEPYAKGRLSVINEMITFLEKEIDKIMKKIDVETDLRKEFVQRGIRKGHMKTLIKLKVKKQNTIKTNIIKTIKQNETRNN